MGPFEEEVATMMDRAIRGNPDVLEALTGGRAFDDTNIPAVIGLLGSMLMAQQAAILRLARALDEFR